VMDRTMPEGVPIEAKMVTRAIERAQNTVEAKNAEARKELLKYDEVRNEQRKVIYARRRQIIDGDDLEEQTKELIAARMEEIVAVYCATDYPEDWDIEKLHLEVLNHFPTTLSREAMGEFSHREPLEEALIEDALTYYEKKCEGFDGGVETAREIERSVMLQLIDQRWQEHMAELDYLMDGIHLRATAQIDPLVAWQREGYSMFESLLTSIDSDYARYILNVQMQPTVAPETDLTRAETNVESVEDAAEGTIDDVTKSNRARHGQPGTRPGERAVNKKVGRNDPCPCGSGKKYKQCHGRP